MPAKTTFHELAHIELGHTSDAVHDSVTLPRNLKEVEAESVALLCLESLGMDGAEFCRGYIQSWLAGAEIPERSAQRIFAAADKILKAGHLGVDFVSLSESIDTSTPMGKMIFTVLAAVAELERNLIKERVQMGITRARKQGKQLGRPRVEVDPLQVAGLRARGLSWNQIADKLGVGRGTAERAFKTLSQKPSSTSANVEHIS